MHTGSICNKCKKRNVCKLIEDYLKKCGELTDTNTDNYVSKLHCKHEEQ